LRDAAQPLGVVNVVAQRVRGCERTAVDHLHHSKRTCVQFTPGQHASHMERLLGTAGGWAWLRDATALADALRVAISIC
jgi:hypothetical protein